MTIAQQKPNPDGSPQLDERKQCFTNAGLSHHEYTKEKWIWSDTTKEFWMRPCDGTDTWTDKTEPDCGWWQKKDAASNRYFVRCSCPNTPKTRVVWDDDYEYCWLPPCDGASTWHDKLDPDCGWETLDYGKVLCSNNGEPSDGRKTVQKECREGQMQWEYEQWEAGNYKMKLNPGEEGRMTSE